MNDLGEIIRAIAAYAQQWQTLLAALVALAAAKRAYAAAMAKVEFDREAAEQASISKKLGLFLRLQHSLIDMLVIVNRASKYLDARIKESDQEKPIELETVSIRIMFPPEITEAWNALELFPANTISALSTFKRYMPMSEEYEALFSDATEGKIKTSFREASSYSEIMRDIKESGEAIYRSLDTAIKEYRVKHKIFA